MSAFYDRIRNEDVLKRAGMPDMERMLKQKRWSWFGHVLRMEDGRVPKQLLCGRVRGRKMVGRTAKRWSDWIREEAPSVYPKLDFLVKARDRPRWRTSCFNMARFANSKGVEPSCSAMVIRVIYWRTKYVYVKILLIHVYVKISSLETAF